MKLDDFEFVKSKNSNQLERAQNTPDDEHCGGKPDFVRVDLFSEYF